MRLGITRHDVGFCVVAGIILCPLTVEALCAPYVVFIRVVGGAW